MERVLCPQLFVELGLDSGGRRPLRRQMFFGNCLCSEFRHWHLCSHPLSRVRREDCEFQEGTSRPSTSARVHRRLCDVTGMSQWNPQCNCSVQLAGAAQSALCGFKTCYAAPLPGTICGPRTVCGTAHCDVGEHGSLFSVRCDRRCRNHRPFCEDPCPPTSVKRSVTSQWAEWRSASSSGGECNMRQDETECLNDHCNKEDSDCICEVKMQDGKLKAYRYMIKFGDEKNQCNDDHQNKNSKLKVRSTGIKGDAKVWDRFIGAAAREDNNKEAISMFGKPIGFEAYLSRRNRIEDIPADSMEASLQNPGNPKQGILQHLVSMVSNRSQLAEKPGQTPKLSENNTVQATSGTSKSGNDTSKLVDQGAKLTPANQTLDSTKPGSLGDKQQVNLDSNQAQIAFNNSNSNVNLTAQNQQNNPQQANKLAEDKRPYHYTPLPYLNMTMVPETVQQNYSDLAKIVGIVKKASNNLDEEILNYVKAFKEKSEAYKHVSKEIENKNAEEIKGSMETMATWMDQDNRGKEPPQVNIDGQKEISNNSDISKESSPDPDRENVNKLIQFLTFSMKSQYLNENVKNKLQDSHLKANTPNEINKSSLQIKETEKNKPRWEASHQPKISSKQNGIKSGTKLVGGNKNNKQKVLGMSSKEDRMKIESLESNSSPDKADLQKGSGEENSQEGEGTKQSGEEKEIGAKPAGEEKGIEAKHSVEDKVLEAKQTDEDKDLEAKQSDEEKGIDAKLIGEEKSIGTKPIGEEKGIEAKLIGEEKGIKANLIGGEKGIGAKLIGEEKGIGAKPIGKEKGIGAKLIGEEKGIEAKLIGEEKGIEAKLIGEEKGIDAKQTREEKGTKSKQTDKGKDTENKPTVKGIEDEGKIGADKPEGNLAGVSGEEKSIVGKQTGEQKGKGDESKIIAEKTKEIAKQTGREKGIEDNTKIAEKTKEVAKQTGREKGIEDERKIGTERTEEDQSQGNENFSGVQEFSLGGNLIGENKAMNQDIDLAEKLTPELKENDDLKEGNAMQDKQKDHEQRKIDTEQSVPSKLISKEPNHEAENEDVTSMIVKRDVTPKLGNQNLEHSLIGDLKNQQRVVTPYSNTRVPITGEQIDTLLDNLEVKNYESPEIVNQVFPHELNQGVTSKLVDNGVTNKLIPQNSKPNPTNIDFKKPQEKIPTSGRQKENVDANGNTNHDGTAKPVNKEFTLKLKSEDATIKLVNKDYTAKLTQPNITPKLAHQDFKSQKEVVPATGKQNNNVHGNEDIKHYVTSKLKSQDGTAKLVNTNATPKSLVQNVTPKIVEPDLKSQQGVVSATQKQKNNEHANEDIKHSVTAKLKSQDDAAKLKSHDTAKLVNADAKNIDKNITPKLVYPNLKSQKGVISTVQKQNNEHAYEDIKHYVTSELKMQDGTAKVENKNVTPKLINLKMTSKLFNQDMKTPQRMTPSISKQDNSNENENKKHYVTSKLANKDITPLMLKNQDFTAKLLNKNVTPKLQSQNLIPKLMNPDLTIQQSTQKNNLGSKEIKLSATPKLIINNSTPKPGDKVVKIQQGTIPLQSKQQNNEQGKPEMKQSVTSKLVNEDITPKLINQNSTPKLMNQDITPKVNQEYDPKLLDQDFTPKKKIQDFTPKVKATKDQVFDPKSVNQEFTPMLKNQEITNKISNQEITSAKSPVLKLSSNSNLSPGAKINSQTTDNPVKLTTVGLQNDDVATNNIENEWSVIEQGPRQSLATGTQVRANITQNSNTAVNSSLTAGKSIKQQAPDKKVNFNDIANIFPTYNLDEITMPSIPTKRRPKIFSEDDEENTIKVKVKPISTPDLLGAIAKKLFKTRSENSLDDPNDPLLLLTDSNPSLSLPEEKPAHDYDDPEPVLKDLNKVDRENVDEKLSDALSKLADLSGKVDWLEKPEIYNNQIDFDQENQEKKDKKSEKKGKNCLKNKSKLSFDEFNNKKLKGN